MISNHLHSEMRRFLVKTMVVIVVGILFMAIYARFCDYFFSDARYLDHISSKRSWILKKRNTVNDYAVLGSSRAYGAFHIKTLDSLLEKKGINIAANGSGLVDNFLLYHLFLENNNKIKYLFINVDSYALSSGLERTFHVYNFLPYWRDEIIKNAILESVGPKERFVLSIAGFLRYYKYNKYFSPLEIVRRYRLGSVDASPWDVNSGGPPLMQGEKAGYIDFRRNPEFPSISSFNLNSLEKIIALSKSRNIQVIAFRPPEFAEFADKRYDGNIEYVYGNIEKMLVEREVPYILDFYAFESHKEYFQDPIHLNKNGRLLYTSLFYHHLSTSQGFRNMYRRDE